MQILKDEVRENILQAATMEFKEKGYQKSSIRTIAKKAGMTEGNVYRYFKNKEHLLQEVVHPAYLQVIDLIQKVPDRFEEKQEINFSWLAEYMMGAIVKISKTYHSQLLILIDGCTGTQYEKAKDEVVGLLEKRMKNFFLTRIEKKGGKIQDPFLAYVIAKGFIEGIILILKEFQNNNKLEGVLSQFHHFYFKNASERFL